MRENKSTTHLTALILGIASAPLAVGAIVAFVAMPGSSAGDVEAVETALAQGPQIVSPDAADHAGRPSGPSFIGSSESSGATTGPNDQAEPLAAAGSRPLDELIMDMTRAPVGVRIQSLGVDAPVEGYGVDEETGQMDVPDNVQDVAWYEHGPAPGRPGSAVLAAHVDLANQGPGVFVDLKDMMPGEQIVVTFDDGAEGVFQVQARRTYYKGELPLDVIFSREGPPVLTLITCGGDFSTSTRSYDSNVVVYATPIHAPSGDVGE